MRYCLGSEAVDWTMWTCCRVQNASAGCLTTAHQACKTYTLAAGIMLQRVVGLHILHTADVYSPLSLASLQQLIPISACTDVTYWIAFCLNYRPTSRRCCQQSSANVHSLCRACCMKLTNELRVALQTFNMFKHID